ncbi:hypothetical protein [Mesorhizobium sp. M0220]|uniref:hypothetical protein n=1 Tax=Mesorhizobium sp. M0220 TaxID=2956920 RepID=UPI00333DE1B7
MRKGLDGLATLIQEQLKKEAFPTILFQNAVPGPNGLRFVVTDCLFVRQCHAVTGTG